MSHKVRMLDPIEIYFQRSEGGVIEAVIAEKTYEELYLYRAFPMKYSGQYISIRSKEGEEIGIINDIEHLSGDSRAIVEEELRYRYFLPKVIRIERIKQKADLWFWDITTNAGHTSIIMRNLHDHMLFPDEKRIILIDIDGRRCDIEDCTLLDAHSQRLLQDVL